MDPIEEFLKNKGKVTQKNYRWVLKQYFDDIKQDPEVYFQSNRNFKDDIQNWWNIHKSEVPKTRNTKLAILRGLFEEYSKIISDLPPKYFKKLRKQQKGSKKATTDHILKKNEFKKILAHGTIKDRAFFLFLISSGCRVGEVLQLKLTDGFVKRLENNPPQIEISGKFTKTGNPRTVFITPESKENLEEWLKIRNDYIRTAVKKCNKEKGGICTKDPNDDRVFPFSYDVAWTSWNRLVKKTGLGERDETTNNYKLHIHCLRKFFLSKLKLEIPEVVAEILAGHEGYLQGTYDKYSLETQAELYKKGMKHLTIFDTTSRELEETNEEVNKLKYQIDNKDKQINEMQDMMQEMKAQILELRLEKLEKINGLKK